MASKTIAFSKLVALPANADRELAISLLHDHEVMIGLNPQVFSHGPIKTPRDAPANESRGHQWHQLSEDISHFSSVMSRTIATYKACYLNARDGVDIHIYGPQGLDVKERWIIAQSAAEYATCDSKPTDCSSGLYLRRDCSLKCIADLPSLAEQNLYQAHQVFLQRLAEKAFRDKRSSVATNASKRSWSLLSLGRFSRSSRDVSRDRTSMSRASFISALDPSDIHPAFRNQMDWSLVPDRDSNDRGRRTQSMYIDDSTHESKSLRRRPNIRTGLTDNVTYDIHQRASLMEFPQTELLLPEDEMEAPELSVITNQPHTQVIDSAYAERYLNNAIEEHLNSANDHYSSDEDEVASRGDSTPSLIDETSDEETSILPELPTPIEEYMPVEPMLPSPSNELSVLDVIRQLRTEMEEGSFERPPPIPKRAEGHSLPAPLAPLPLCIRPAVVQETHVQNTSLPIDLLPLRSTSVRGTKAARKSSKKAMPTRPGLEAGRTFSLSRISSQFVA